MVIQYITDAENALLLPVRQEYVSPSPPRCGSGGGRVTGQVAPHPPRGRGTKREVGEPLSRSSQEGRRNHRSKILYDLRGKLTPVAVPDVLLLR